MLFSTFFCFLFLNYASTCLWVEIKKEAIANDLLFFSLVIPRNLKAVFLTTKLRIKYTVKTNVLRYVLLWFHQD